jgi:hypothetical protein
MNNEKNDKKRKKGDKNLFSVFCLLSSVLCLLSSVFCVLSGCARQQKYETIEQIYAPDMDKTEAMQIAEDVLARMHFTIEKADYESGVIRTKPLPGAQFFELWRSDNIGAYNAAEANLHSIRRTAELHISQKTEVAVPQRGDENLTSDIYPPTPVLCIDCDVQAQRLNLPVSREWGKHLSSQRLSRLTQTAGATWTDLGTDTRLATEILKRICSRLDARGSSLDIEYRESGIE